MPALKTDTNNQIQISSTKAENWKNVRNTHIPSHFERWTLDTLGMGVDSSVESGSLGGSRNKQSINWVWAEVRGGSMVEYHQTPEFTDVVGATEGQDHDRYCCCGICTISANTVPVRVSGWEHLDSILGLRVSCPSVAVNMHCLGSNQVDDPTTSIIYSLIDDISTIGQLTRRAMLSVDSVLKCIQLFAEWGIVSLGHQILFKNCYEYQHQAHICGSNPCKLPVCRQYMRLAAAYAYISPSSYQNNPSFDNSQRILSIINFIRKFDDKQRWNPRVGTHPTAVDRLGNHTAVSFKRVWGEMKEKLDGLCPVRLMTYLTHCRLLSLAQ
jgi:hypothetical protein